MTTAISENEAQCTLGDIESLCAEIALPESRTAAIVDLLDRMLAADARSAFVVLVQELERDLGGPRVLLGLAASEGKNCRLAGSTMHWDSAERSAIEAAMRECLARGENGQWPADEHSPRHALKAHEVLAARTHSECVFSLPLVDRKGTVQGVLLLLGETKFAADREARRFLQAAAQPVASAMAVVQKAKPGLLGRWRNRAGAFVRSQKLLAALIGLAATIGVLLIPMPYRIACECQIEPVARRFVAAPFDGTLERSVVEPGDVVAEGQLLAVMDGREIRWELAGIVAEQGQARKERDGHLARHDFGAAQVARLEVERLQQREKLLRKRSENLEIRSPIAGIVVTGDLKKSEGVPLSVGERLFEIAPLERMVVEVAIPEQDIPWAEPGQIVEVVLDAYPETTWTEPLRRVHPRAELREEEHVFIGEVLLDNPDALLRPGMRGRAKIVGPRKPLGWNLFHKPWYELRYWLGW